jgi:hypothetical protein
VRISLSQESQFFLFTGRKCTDLLICRWCQSNRELGYLEGVSTHGGGCPGPTTNWFYIAKKTNLCKIFFLNWFCLRLATTNFPIWGGILFDLKIIFSFCSTFGASKKSTLKDIFCISSEHPIKISHSIQWILKWNYRRVFILTD